MTPMTPAEAIKLAVDAIENDPRRTPYGHHQHGRDRAIRTLRALGESAVPTGGESVNPERAVPDPPDPLHHRPVA